MPVAFIRRFLSEKELTRCNKYLLEACSPSLKDTAEKGNSIQTLTGVYADNSLVFMYVGLRGDTLLSFAEDPRPIKKPSNFVLFKYARKSIEIAEKVRSDVSSRVDHGMGLYCVSNTSSLHFASLRSSPRRKCGRLVESFWAPPL